MKTIDEVIWQLEMCLYDNDVHQYHVKYVIPYLKEYNKMQEELDKNKKQIEELNKIINHFKKAHEEIDKKYKTP